MDNCKGNRKQKQYIVYNYKYVGMDKPKMDAKVNKMFPGGTKTIDTLPPTVIDLFYVDACNKKEALLKAKPLFEKRKDELKKFL